MVVILASTMLRSVFLQYMKGKESHFFRLFAERGLFNDPGLPHALFLTFKGTASRARPAPVSPQGLRPHGQGSGCYQGRQLAANNKPDIRTWNCHRPAETELRNLRPGIAQAQEQSPIPLFWQSGTVFSGYMDLKSRLGNQ
jgi:hypothetical protein